MTSFTYLRAWCPECFRETTQRRYGSEDHSSAKVECAEHGAGPQKAVDWVGTALRSAGHAS